MNCLQILKCCDVVVKYLGFVQAGDETLRSEIHLLAYSILNWEEL